jgi:hypothetical protein
MDVIKPLQGFGLRVYVPRISCGAIEIEALWASLKYRYSYYPELTLFTYKSFTYHRVIDDFGDFFHHFGYAFRVRAFGQTRPDDSIFLDGIDIGFDRKGARRGIAAWRRKIPPTSDIIPAERCGNTVGRWQLNRVYR